MNIATNKKLDVLEMAGLFYTFAITFSLSTGTTIVRISRVLIFLITLFTIIKKSKFRIITSSYTTWSVLFIFFSGISWVWAVSRELALSSISTQLYIVVIDLILVYILYRNSEYIFSIMKVIILSAILHGLKIYLVNGFDAYLFTRGGAEIENANILAYTASFAAIFSFIIILFNKYRYKLVYLTLGFLSGIFALLTASKKVFIFFGVFGIIYYIFKSRNPIRIIKNFIFSLIAVIIIIYMIFNIDFLYELVGSRFETMIMGFMGGPTDGSTSFRMNLISWGIDWFNEKPLIGYGLNCYKYLLGSTYDTWAGSAGVYAHNNYIELLVDLGLIGTVIYYYLYVRIMIRSYSLYRKGNTVSIVSLALIITMMVAEYGQISYSIAFLQEIILITWFLAFEYSKKYQSNYIR